MMMPVTRGIVTARVAFVIAVIGFSRAVVRCFLGTSFCCLKGAANSFWTLFVPCYLPMFFVDLVGSLLADLCETIG